MATNCIEQITGMLLPDPIARMAWQHFPGSNQAVGEDRYGNIWRREGTLIWTTLESEHREAVYLPVFIAVDEHEKVSSLSIEAYFSAPMGGRPSDLKPQVREINQVGRLVMPLFGLEFSSQ